MGKWPKLAKLLKKDLKSKKKLKMQKYKNKNIYKNNINSIMMIIIIKVFLRVDEIKYL